MAKKFGFNSSGAVSNIGGAAGGGIINAAYDRYLASYLMMGETGKEKPYGQYVKAAIGLAVPFFIENRMVQTGANVLLGCAISDIMKDVAFRREDKTIAPPASAAVKGLSHVAGSSHVGNTRRNWSIPLSAQSRQALTNGNYNRQKAPITSM